MNGATFVRCIVRKILRDGSLGMSIDIALTRIPSVGEEIDMGTHGIVYVKRVIHQPAAVGMVVTKFEGAALLEVS